MIVIGASGHALDMLLDIKKVSSEEDIVFFDDVSELLNQDLSAYRFIRSIEELRNQSENDSFTLALGSPAVRKQFFLKCIDFGLKPLNIISDKAYCGEIRSQLLCVNIMPFAAVFSTAYLGKAVLINSYASVHHGARIGDYSVISPGSRILGNAVIGDGVEVGSNAVVLPGVKVNDGAIIGAGAVVTKDVPSGETFIGVPARTVKKFG